MDSNEQKIGIEENCGKGIIETTNQNAEGMQELTEEMSSTSINKNATEEIENKEQKSTKKRLRFGGWLPDCLDWFKRPELALSSLPTSSYTFNRYCLPKLHGKVKSRVVRRLTFWRELDDEGNLQTILETDRHIRIPIDIKPPDYIIGYKWICICFIDDRVLQFVRHILPLLNEVKIYFRRVKFENNQQIGLLMELLAPKINKLELYELDEPLITDLDELYPNFISGLQSICLQNAEPAGIDMDLALKWLTTPREDGKPKMLEIHFPNTSDDRNETIFIGKFMEKRIERFKKEFIRSTEPVNFIMLYTLTASFPILARQFEIENEATKEILELKLMKSKKDYFTKHFLIRRKNDGETTPKVDDLDKQFERKEETYFGICL